MRSFSFLSLSILVSLLIIACGSESTTTELATQAGDLEPVGASPLETVPPTRTFLPSPTTEPTALPTTPAPTRTPLPPPTTEPTALPTTPSPTDTPAEPGSPALQPPDARTGLPDVDAVISAILSNDPAARIPLVRLTEVGCTQADGLGGPPKCQEGEAEGTILEALPILGPEGHHALPENIEMAMGFQVEGLYAVYYFSENVWDSADYPRGEIGLLFLLSEPGFPITVHVTDGAIVRLDYAFGSDLAEVLERGAAEIILPPAGSA